MEPLAEMLAFKSGLYESWEEKTCLNDLGLLSCPMTSVWLLDISIISLHQGFCFQLKF